MTRELVARITEYLGAGGLWNPEMMDHDKVRDLLIDCRSALADAPHAAPHGTTETAAVCGSLANGTMYKEYGCGRSITMATGVRCLDCGIRLCDQCARKHFVSHDAPSPVSPEPTNVSKASREGDELLARLEAYRRTHNLSASQEVTDRACDVISAIGRGCNGNPHYHEEIIDAALAALCDAAIDAHGTTETGGKECNCGAGHHEMHAGDCPYEIAFMRDVRVKSDAIREALAHVRKIPEVAALDEQLLEYVVQEAVGVGGRAALPVPPAGTREAGGRLYCNTCSHMMHEATESSGPRCEYCERMAARAALPVPREGEAGK